MFLVIGTLFLCASPLSALDLIADFTQAGYKGSLTLSQNDAQSDIQIRLSITGKTRARSAGWKVLQSPKDMTAPHKCSDINDEVFVNFEDFFGKVTIPGEKTLTARRGMDHRFNLFGNSTLWGKAVVIGEMICSNFRFAGEENVKLATAKFNQALVSGSTLFRTITIGSKTHTLLYTDLFDSWNDPPRSTDHNWQLYYADPSTKPEDALTNCDFLKTPAAPDFSAEVGKIRVAATRNKFSKKQFTLAGFNMPPLTGSKGVYLALKDARNARKIYACAEVTEEFAKESTTVFGSKGVKGTLRFEQRDPFSLTRVVSDIDGLAKQGGDYHIHEYPLKTIDTCKGAGGHFNPTYVKTDALPPPGVGTHDQYEFGDISGKHGTLRGLDYLRGEVWDHFLPLWGKHSIQGRSVMIHDAFTGAGWVCANIIISKQRPRPGGAKRTTTRRGKPEKLQTMNTGIENGMNNQIKMELEASYMYMSMSAYFGRPNVALPGLSKYFRKASHDARNRAEKLIDFMNQRGGSVAFSEIRAPAKNQWESGLTAMEEAMQMEKRIDAALTQLHRLSNEDPKAGSFLENMLLLDQTMILNEITSYVTQLNRLGNGIGEFTFDQKMLEKMSN